MKQQKLVQIHLSRLDGNKTLELSIQKYLDNGWVIVSYQVCPQSVGGGNCNYSTELAGDVVVLLEKE